jgi:hypothetical protein
MLVDRGDVCVCGELKLGASEDPNLRPNLIKEQDLAAMRFAL